MKKAWIVGVALSFLGCLDYTDRGVSPEFEAILAGQSGDNASAPRLSGPGQGSVATVTDGTGSNGSECESLWFSDIKPMLDSKCGVCHGDPPVVGPNPLVTLDHMFVESPFGTPTYERVYFRMEQNTMPPSGGNTDEEIAVVAAWVDVCEAEASAPAVLESDTEESGEPEDAIGSEEDPDDTVEGSEPLEEDGEAEEESGESDEEEEGEDLDCVPDPNGPDWVNDIKPLFDVKCGTCHGSPLAGGAPFPLVSYADVTTVSVGSGIPRYERCLVRMETDTMPPGGTNSDAEVQLVEDWITNCVLEDRDALSSSLDEEGEESTTEEGDTAESEEGAEVATEEGGSQAMTWDVLLPFLEDDCGPCHFGGAATSFSYAYASGGVGGSYYCSTLTVAECFIERILDTTMPPPTSGIKVQSETVDAIEAWIDGGLQP